MVRSAEHTNSTTMIDTGGGWWWWWLSLSSSLCPRCGCPGVMGVIVLKAVIKR